MGVRAASRGPVTGSNQGSGTGERATNVSTADGAGSPELEAGGRSRAWVDVAISIGFIVVGLVFSATNPGHPLGGLVVVPVVFGLVRLGSELRMVREGRVRRR